MKKLLSLLLCGALLLATGCAYAAISNQPAVYDLYYLEANLQSAVGDDALRAEQVRLDEDPTTTEALAAALLTRFLEGPQDESLKNPVPAGTRLLSVRVDQGMAQVDLSSPYDTLSGVGLTLADYAITLTLTQLEAVSAVEITVRGQELSYREKQLFRKGDVLLSPKEDVVSSVDAALYFPDETGTLRREFRTLDLYEGDTQVGVVARALELGPETKGLTALMPEGFRIRNLWLEDHICYVNLSSALMGTLSAESGQRDQILDALCRSLYSLEAVEEVEILVDGEFYENQQELPRPMTSAD